MQKVKMIARYYCATEQYITSGIRVKTFAHSALPLNNSCHKQEEYLLSLHDDVFS